MSVSFTTLFERSRFSDQGRRLALDDPIAEQYQKQRERFAVAAIGFALEHDPAFRSHFLGDVCGLKDVSDAGGWDILVEPRTWGDLVLEHPSSRFLLVVEFKIDSGLKDHQNPEIPRFNAAEDGQCAGYGWKIRQFAQANDWTRVQYVTIEKQASWSAASKHDGHLTCIPLEWRRFLRSDVSQESRIEEDLYNCLGRLGVVEFIARKMNKTKVAEVGTVPFAVLLGVLARFGVEFKADFLKGSGDEAFGFYPDLRTRGFRGMGNLVLPEGGNVWFGYTSFAAELPLGPHACVEIWYNAARDKSALRNRIEHGLLKSGFERSGSQDLGWGMRIFRPASHGSDEGDMEWFVRVLSALNEAGSGGPPATAPRTAAPEADQSDVGG